MRVRQVQGAAKTSGEHLSPFSPLLTGLELASGIVVGEELEAPRLPQVAPGLEPLEALRQAMIPHLERTPCLVAFSGGRDSSIVLAAAASVARREGLDLPIPITYRFPGIAATDEKDWQELVIRSTRTPDWIRQDLTDELDLVGPLAQESVLRYGILYPAGSYHLLPMLRETRGGTLLTGLGGDEILRHWRWSRLRSVLAGRALPTPRDVLRLGAAIAPGRLRAAALSRIRPVELPWLTKEASAVTRRRLYAYLATEPVAWDKRTAWSARERSITLIVRSFDIIAEESGAKVAHPLLEPNFLAALAGAGGTRGFGTLAETMRTHFGSLLPSQLIERTSKSHFDDVYWGPHSREFIRACDIESTRIEFVDWRPLAEVCRRGEAFAHTLLQALWLHSHHRTTALAL